MNSPTSRQKTTWRWLMLIGHIEAISLLALMFVAMPLKYLAGNAAFVHVIGPIHGYLFVLYVAVVLVAWRVLRWPIGRTFLALVASSVPFGPFLFEAWLRRQPDAAIS